MPSYIPSYISLVAFGVSGVIKGHVWVSQIIRNAESIFRDQSYADPLPYQNQELPIYNVFCIARAKL